MRAATGAPDESVSGGPLLVAKTARAKRLVAMSRRRERPTLLCTRASDVLRFHRTSGVPWRELPKTLGSWDILRMGDAVRDDAGRE